jgi:predicted O-linked N-acetylglucosamine transferase (SPINDLY family)
MTGQHGKAGSLKAKALAFLEKNQNREARVAFEDILRVDRSDAEVWYYLGIIETRFGAYDKAEQHLRQATALRPQLEQAWYWLGNVQTYLGKAAEAAQSYERLLQLSPANIVAWNKLGRAQIESGRHTDAERCFRHVLQLKPDHAEAHVSLGQILSFHGRTEDAQEHYRRAFEIDPDSPRAAIGYHLTLPLIYHDAEHLLMARERYSRGLDALLAGLDRFTQCRGLIAELDWSNNFYLAYQGLDDKELQVKYARFFQTLAAQALPQFMQPVMPQPAGNRRIRVGFASHYFREHTVSYYFNGWIVHADRGRFETFVYHIDPVMDAVSSMLASACDHYRPLSGLIPSMAQTIKNDRLDILVYPEIGMHPKHMWLAALRLAPVQCAAWGHPVTTGLASMDYYISADATEPDGAETHYSEKLVRLPGVGICSPAAAAPVDGAHSRFDLPDDRTLYLCSQSLFKVHPEMDALFVEIAAGDPRGLILLFEDTKANLTALFRRRLETAFAKRGLTLDQHARFLPRMPHADYLRLSRLCDLMLDTPHWSGGRTTLDALACGLPVVTLPCRFSRGRQTFGMLRELDMPELIATGADDYVVRAVALGRDRDRRQHLSREIIRRGRGTIFDNLGPVRSLEEFFYGTTQV